MSSTLSNTVPIVKLYLVTYNPYNQQIPMNWMVGLVLKLSAPYLNLCK